MTHWAMQVRAREQEELMDHMESMPIQDDPIPAEEQDDPVAALYASMEQSAQFAAGFQGWMNQQLAVADEENRQRQQEQDAVDRQMWDIVEQQRAANPGPITIPEPGPAPW